MTTSSARFAAILLASAVSLAACEEFEGARPGADPQATAASLGAEGARTVVRDVERPDVFSVTEAGLWDGRPSLGGVWVAHPDVTDPERAKITNNKSGQTIEGALFRRERANPGPRIQVSSDAAAALGLLAGQPTELTIVAVRREEIELEPEPLPLSGEETGPVSEQEASVASGDGDNPAAVAAAEATEEPPRRQGFWARFRDSLRNKPAGADEASPETAETAAVPEVETAPLDPVATAAAAAISEAEAEPAARSESVTGIQNPFIQVGLFGQEDNASAVAANLRQAGIVPQIRGQKSGGKTLWRVFIGPITSAEDQDALLAQVRRLGYTDAFLAPN